MGMIEYLWVGAGGFIGSVLRYIISINVPTSDFPFATLGINLVGSFVLAFVAVLTLNGLVSSERVSLLLRVGLCGGFTTFSTFSFETMQLAQQGDVLLACAYALLSCVLCVVASFAGYAVGGLLA